MLPFVVKPAITVKRSSQVETGGRELFSYSIDDPWRSLKRHTVAENFFFFFFLLCFTSPLNVAFTLGQRRTWAHAQGQGN